MARQIQIKFGGMVFNLYRMILLSLLLFQVLMGGSGWERTAFGEEWQPVTRSSEKIVSASGETWRCYSPANPHYYADSTGKLKAIDFSAIDEVEEIGGKQYSKKAKMPISSGMLKNATYEKFVSVHSDLDWQYPDRRMEWTLVDAEFNKTKKMPKLDSPTKISNLVRKASDEYAVYNDRTTVRLAQRIPIKSSTNFVVTYRLRLVDLTIAGLSEEPTSEEFTVTTLGGEFRFRIRLPKLLDADFKVVSQNTLHSIVQISDGLYEYKKFPSSKLTLEEMQAATWIDADTCYSSTNDGCIRKDGSKNTWSTVIGSTTGDSVYAEDLHITASQTIIDTCMRAYFYFNTIGLSGTIQSGTIKLYGVDNDYGDGYNPYISAFIGTQGDTLSVNDYDNFTGSTITDYVLVSESPWAWYTWTLNSTGKSSIVLGGTTKVCFREQYDSSAVQPTQRHDMSVVSTEYDGTIYDPYLTLVIIPFSSAYAYRQQQIFYLENILGR